MKEEGCEVFTIKNKKIEIKSFKFEAECDTPNRYVYDFDSPKVTREEAEENMTRKPDAMKKLLENRMSISIERKKNAEVPSGANSFIN